MRLVLMGPPGAGKGTQGELLAGRYSIPRYSTGEILRAARHDGSELGQEAREYMDAGELVPDVVILGLMRKVLLSAETGDGYLLDGFPRTVAQAEGLRDLLREVGQQLDAVVNLTVDDAVIVRRLSSRKVCENCGTIARPDGGIDSCAGCGGQLLTRPDDRPATVQRRLEVYRDQTEPVLAWYRESCVTVLDIVGVGDIEQVQERIVSGLAS